MRRDEVSVAVVVDWQVEEEQMQHHLVDSITLIMKKGKRKKAKNT